MWKVIVLKWDSLVLGLVSFAYGLQLFLFPSILGNYQVYRLIRDIFDSHIVGMLFIVLGGMKFIGVLVNNSKLKKISLFGLAFLWTLFGVSFLFSPPPNTVWIFSLCMALTAFGIGMREV